MDKFYTKQSLADRYVEQLLKTTLPKNAVFLEPSAGAGAFYKPLLAAGRDVMAIDIEPSFEGIHKQDFYCFDAIKWSQKKPIITIGNPPFGKASAEAVKFFNTAAGYSDIIAFILPRTFRKRSIKLRLNKLFHVCVDEDLPPLSFFKDGIPHDVPCCWQIWEKQTIIRQEPTVPDVSNLIQYTTPPQADFAVRRVGGRAGEVLNGIRHSPSSTYFLQEVSKGVVELMKTIDWSGVRDSTAGVRSVSKNEIAIALDKVVNG